VNVGIIPPRICIPGNIGIISRSGTLTYEIIHHLTINNLGQSTCIGIGGDPIHGIGFVECLQLFEHDPQTKSIVLIGEIGGTEEEIAAEFIQTHIKKPIIVYLAGLTAPLDKQMGHAGAIISRGKGTIQSKISAFQQNRIPIATVPSDIPVLLKKIV
jgi:succinyl-CoA synthetase alpha subunit